MPAQMHHRELQPHLKPCMQVRCMPARLWLLELTIVCHVQGPHTVRPEEAKQAMQWLLAKRMAATGLSLDTRDDAVAKVDLPAPLRDQGDSVVTVDKQPLPPSD